MGRDNPLPKFCLVVFLRETMNYQKLLKDNRFRWLVVTLLIVAPFEVLSFFSIHFPLWVELPLFLVIIAVFGKEVFISGIKSLLKLDFSILGYRRGNSTTEIRRV